MEFGYRLGLIQCQRTVELALAEFRLGARVRQLAVRLLGNRFKGPGIDDVQEVAGIDEGAVAKFDVGDESADPGANLNLLHRLEPPGEFVPIGDGASGRLCDRDRRWRACGLLRRLVSAAGQGDCEQNDQRSDNVKCVEIERFALSWRLRFLSLAQFHLLCTSPPRSKRPPLPTRLDQDEIEFSVCSRTTRDQAKMLCIGDAGIQNTAEPADSVGIIC